MEVREQLVEIMSDLGCNAEYCEDCEFCNDIDGCVRRQKEIIADRLIAHGVTVQEWISVNEPPTKQGWYHVAIKDLKTGKYRVENDLYAVETAIAHGHSVGFCKEKAWPERDKLTHWCHYPQPPKGE